MKPLYLGEPVGRLAGWQIAGNNLQRMNLQPSTDEPSTFNG
ncbi:MULTISPECIES: hypothetical protein [Moorena]|nr:MULTISPECIES: hypothetical protein [Moorena]